jgi:hypothetical protein
MGGEYVSDWQVGSAIGWQDADGSMLTRGTILDIEAEQLLQHNLFAKDDPGGEEGAPVVSVITYSLHGIDEHTILIGREEFTYPLEEDVYTETSEGWQAALEAFKDVAEKAAEA